MAEWLDRFVENPTADGDLYFGRNGQLGRYAPSILEYNERFVREIETIPSERIFETKEQKARRLVREKQQKSLFAPDSPEWNPFSDIRPWCYNGGLLHRIKSLNLMNAFLKKLGLEENDATEKLFDLIMAGPYRLSGKMAEALVEILTEKGLRP
jgi:hypothetical protein